MEDYFEPPRRLVLLTIPQNLVTHQVSRVSRFFERRDIG